MIAEAQLCGFTYDDKAISNRFVALLVGTAKTVIVPKLLKSFTVVGILKGLAATGTL